ncbi:MAG: LCP family protein [Bacillota bacterium]
MEERKGWLAWLLAGLIITALTGGFAFYRPFEAPVKAVAPAMVPPPPPPELDSLPGQRQTFLVMGVDNIDGEFGRADSMVVVSFDPREQRLAMLSIPRDTWTMIPGHGYDKINHAYAYGGHTLAIDTVERLLGIDIDHWGTLSFEGFMQVVDAVGGVEIEVEKRLFYEDPVDERLGAGGLVIDIQPGRQNMDGETALKYARFRADEEGDVGRMRRQQQVIQALIRKSATPAILGRVPQLIPALYSAVGTDLSVAEMLKLAAGGREALTRPLVTGTLGGEARMLNGIYYLVTDIESSRATAYEVLVGSPPDAEFLQRARQTQKAYTAALEEAMARSAVAAEPGGEAGEGTEAGENGTGEQSPPKTPTAPDSSAPTKPPSVKTEVITVALIDATGRGLWKEYVAPLRAAGFRIARIAKSPKLIQSTVVIDHAQQPKLEERLRAIFPDLFYASAPDPNAGEALEIILGTDLLEQGKP